jgi:tRNA pseudouridine13 synthase
MMSAVTQARFEQLARAYPVLLASARLKQTPEDFVVTEALPFELSGGGEHVWLQVRKRNCNTDWLAGRIAAFAAVKRKAVGYAGLKDRNAVTTQWFSVHLPGQDDIDWAGFQLEDVGLLQIRRHQRKLQRGTLKHNAFVIRLRKIEFGVDGSIEAVDKRCDLIRQQGVPNYYGEQRFGRGLMNLIEAERMFAEPRRRLSRHKRSLYLSAARSWMFNCMLSQRVQAGTWNRRIDGDVFMLDGRSACFRDDGSADLDERLQQGAIHPTAVLWGSGEAMARSQCAAIEAAVIERFPLFEQGLRDARVAQQRRALRVRVPDLSARWEGVDLVLAFSLQAGSYATMVLREILALTEIQANAR